MSQEKPISIREFKMWLQGVEEMQEDGWCPTVQQWEKIRQKINSINDTVVTPTQTPTLPPVTYAGPVPRAPLTPVEQLVPAGPSSLTIPPVYQPTNPILAAAGGSIKTPDIDTSTNGYSSGFV